MRKIPTLYVRDPADMRHVLRDIAPGCEWVLAGEGEATRKWDGTCVLLDHCHRWWARREVKPGKAAPEGYQAVQHDPVTGKTAGWEPMAQAAFAKIHAEAVTNSGQLTPGTYELVGPKINRNPDGFDAHLLIPHGWAPLSVRRDYATAPRTFDSLRDWLHARPYEGIVWHRTPGDPDSDMVKIKKKDFAAITPTDHTTEK